MTKFICGREKYVLGGPKEDSIGLPVSFSNLPKKMDVEGYTLLLKNSFHISLVSVGKIIDNYKVLTSDFLDRVVADFCDFVRENEIELIGYRDEFRFVSENERRAVIAMCDVSNINKFFDLINEKYKLNLEYPPTHVTLYTLQPDSGIFVTDANGIEKFTKPIANPGLALK